MSRRVLYIGLAVGVLVVAALAGFLIFRPFSPTVTSAAPATTQQSVLPMPEAERLQTALTSGDPQVTSASLAPALRDSFLKRPFSLLPNGSTAVVDPASLVDQGTAGTVNVAVDNADTVNGKWTLRLTKADGRWMIAGTVRA